MSAQVPRGACHRQRTGAALAASRVGQCRELVADTGCTKTLLSDDFRHYVKKEHSVEQQKIQLAGDKQQITAGGDVTVHLPVVDCDGRARMMVERAAIASDVRYPLLACSKRPIVKDLPSSMGLKDMVLAKDIEGKDFWLPIRHSSGLPMVCVINERDKALAGKDTKITLDDQVPPDKIRILTADEKAEVLLRQHYRLAHATGRRLYLTLNERGWGNVFTLKECGEVACPACRLLNRKSAKVPRVIDVSRVDIQPGEVAYQDLTHMPNGEGGFKLLSLIVDASSRRLSAMPLRRKDQALSHCVAYIERLRQEGQKIRVWKSDNGGEFINDRYTTVLADNGIAQQTGAPYTPQSQGLVERANGTVKRLFGKVLRSLGLPVSVWPGLVQGVVQAINNVVHASTGQSPYKKAGLLPDAKLPAIAMGDSVQVVDPYDNLAKEGYYGGSVSAQVASCIVRSNSGGWRILKVHPSSVRLLGWGGSVTPQVPGLWTPATAAAPKQPGDIEYDIVDADQYVEGPGLGEEEPPEQIPGPERDDDRHPNVGVGNNIIAVEGKQQLGPGAGVVAVKDNQQIVAKVVHAYKRRLDVARYEPSGEEWQPAELVSVPRSQVLETFALEGGERVPLDIRQRFQGEQQADENADHEHMAAAEEAGAGQLEEERVLSAQVTSNVSENKSKNQIAATREDIRAGSHKEADMKELRSYFNNKVLGPRVEHVTPEIRKKTLRAAWRRTLKGEGDSRKAKSRLYVIGSQDKRDLSWVETYSGTMDPGLQHTAIIYGLQRRFKAAKADIETAFFKAESEEELYMQMPDDLHEEAKELGYVPGGIYRQLKAVYGRADSPRLFTQAFKKIAKQEGWIEIEESILIKKKGDVLKGILFMHMDDLICLADDPISELRKLHKHFSMGSIEMMTAEQASRYIGLDIKWDAEGGLCEISQASYAKSIETNLSDKLKRRAFGPQDLKKSEANEVNMDLQKTQQEWTGVLGWLAKTQPNIQVAFSELSRNSTTPSEYSVQSVKKGCEYAKQIHEPLRFSRVGQPVVCLWVDASYNIYTCEGRLGYEIQVLDESDFRCDVSSKDCSLPSRNLIFWRSVRCSRKLASTTSAEMYAMMEGLKKVPLYIRMCETLWGTKPRVCLFTDSQPLLGWLGTGWVKTDPLCQGGLDFIISRIRELAIHVRWVPTSNQKADRQTKFIPVRISK